MLRTPYHDPCCVIKIIQQNVYAFYVADALQLATAHIVGAKRFVTADKMLIRIAKKEGFDVIELAG
ncbi:MAG: hypothetical protein AMDU3_IPLC00001G0304 [Thermoplasmatales archaeon I-plasma]|jgi:predicted nucleic acid-binding protein|nr:MAG: hypothetical protein AMDU3_IPLC00001G0304 [Thermoplasmatales archaeon I-plasma]